MKLVGSAELILPLPFIKEFQDSVRVTLFTDFGNVYKSGNFDLSDLRYSSGIAGVWVSPFGQVSISFAKPWNDEAGDRAQSFQFNFGTGF